MAQAAGHHQIAGERLRARVKVAGIHVGREKHGVRKVFMQGLQDQQLVVNVVGKDADVDGLRERAAEVLAVVGASGLAEKLVGEMSAGQQRRVALARVLLLDSALWLLDEPTVGLDVASLSNLQILIKKHLNDGGMVIAATHTELGIKSSHELHMDKTP